MKVIAACFAVISLRSTPVCGTIARRCFGKARLCEGIMFCVFSACAPFSRPARLCEGPLPACFAPGRPIAASFLVPPVCAKAHCRMFCAVSSRPARLCEGPLIAAWSHLILHPPFDSRFLFDTGTQCNGWRQVCGAMGFPAFFGDQLATPPVQQGTVTT